MVGEPQRQAQAGDAAADNEHLRVEYRHEREVFVKQRLSYHTVRDHFPHRKSELFPVDTVSYQRWTTPLAPGPEQE
jgi:hypothetical protein